MTPPDHPVNDNDTMLPTKTTMDLGVFPSDVRVELKAKPSAFEISDDRVKSKEETRASIAKADPIELWKQIVHDIWKSAVDALAEGNPGARQFLDDESGRAFEEWLAAQVDPREALLLSASTEPGRPVEATEALEGSPETLLLQVRVNAERFQGNPAGLESFYRGTVVATVRRLEKENATTREMLTDLVIQPLLRLSSRGTDLFLGDALCRFASGAWAYLDEQTEGRGEGFFSTLFNLAQWTSQKGGKEGRQLVRYYYDRLLREGPQLTGSEVTKVAANNLAGHIANEMQRHPETYRGDARSTAAHILNQMHLLATVAKLTEVDVREAVATQQALDFWRSVGWLRRDGNSDGDGAQALRSAHALIGMANVASAWDEVDWAFVLPSTESGAQWRSFGEDWQAVMSAHAALARMVFNEKDDYDDIGSAFFNVGAALGRISGRKVETALLRVAVNALGLRWALERANGMDQAMEDYHGLDCAVNFLGALTDVSDVETAPVEALAAELFAWRVQGNATDALVKYHRMENSLRELNIDSGSLPTVEPSLPAAREALMNLLEARFPSLAGPNLMKPGDPQTLGPLAQELWRLFGDTLGDDEFKKQAADLYTLLDALADKATDLPAAWQTLYGDWVGEGSPIVDAGLMDQNAWRGLEARAVHPINSLADWLRENLRDIAVG